MDALRTELKSQLKAVAEKYATDNKITYLKKDTKAVLIEKIVAHMFPSDKEEVDEKPKKKVVKKKVTETVEKPVEEVTETDETEKPKKKVVKKKVAEPTETKKKVVKKKVAEPVEVPKVKEELILNPPKKMVPKPATSIRICKAVNKLGKACRVGALEIFGFEYCQLHEDDYKNTVLSMLDEFPDMKCWKVKDHDLLVDLNNNKMSLKFVILNDKPSTDYDDAVIELANSLNICTLDAVKLKRDREQSCENIKNSIRSEEEEEE